MKSPRLVTLFVIFVSLALSISAQAIRPRQQDLSWVGRSMLLELHIVPGANGSAESREWFVGLGHQRNEKLESLGLTVGKGTSFAIRIVPPEGDFRQYRIVRRDYVGETANDFIIRPKSSRILEFTNRAGLTAGGASFSIVVQRRGEALDDNFADLASFQVQSPERWQLGSGVDINVAVLSQGGLIGVSPFRFNLTESFALGFFLFDDTVPVPDSNSDTGVDNLPALEKGLVATVGLSYCVPLGSLNANPGTDPPLGLDFVAGVKGFSSRGPFSALPFIGVGVRFIFR